MTEATPRPWTVEQAGKPSPLDEGVYDANHNHVNLYQHLDLIVSAVNKHGEFENAIRSLEAPLVAAKRAAEKRAALVTPLTEALRELGHGEDSGCFIEDCVGCAALKAAEEATP